MDVLVMDMMLIALIMVIISQCMHISKHPLHSLNIYNYSLRKLKTKTHTESPSTTEGNWLTILQSTEVHVTH